MTHARRQHRAPPPVGRDSPTLPRIAAKLPRPPGGQRKGRAEVTRRLAAVEKLLAADAPRARIVAECAKAGMSARTVDDYTRRVRERWTAEAAEARPVEREQTIARLRTLAVKLEKARAWGALVNVERLLADVRGVRAPHRLDVRADVDATITGPETVEQAIDMLLAGASDAARVIEADPVHYASNASTRARVEAGRDALGRAAAAIEGAAAGRTPEQVR